MGRVQLVGCIAAILLVAAATAATLPTAAKPKRIAIIGEGVIGLSTATAILEQAAASGQTNLRLDIFSNQDWEQTLSRGIAGLFRIDQGTAINRVYGNYTFARMARLFRSVGGRSGVQMVSGHIISDSLEKLEKQEKSYGDIVYNFHYMTERELRTQLELENYNVHGIHYTAYTSEGLRYCPYMKSELQKDDRVTFHKRHIQSVAQLANDGYDVVVNCAGIQGAIVAADGDEANVFPIRGVLLRVEAPWHKHFLYKEFSTFTIPVINGVYIGSVKQEHRTDLNTSNTEIMEIFNRYSKLQPAISEEPIVHTFVGLRPGRETVRLEAKMKKDEKGRKYKVVHNYGHAGNGFTLGYGSSMHAAKLALDLDTKEFDDAIKADGGKSVHRDT